MKELTVKQSQMITDVEQLDFNMEFRLRDVWEELGFSEFRKAARALENLKDEVDFNLDTDVQVQIEGGKEIKEK
jgi:hypothetical protein